MRWCWQDRVCFFGGGGGSASAPVPPPPPPSPATAADASIQQAGAMQRTALANAAGAGFDNTIVSSPMGAPAANTSQKQLLGG